jgi:hypothetical protein
MLVDKGYGYKQTVLFMFLCCSLLLKNDYGDLFDYDEDIVKPLIGQVKEFVGEIRKHI